MVKKFDSVQMRIYIAPREEEYFSNKGFAA